MPSHALSLQGIGYWVETAVVLGKSDIDEVERSQQTGNDIDGEKITQCRGNNRHVAECMMMYQ